MRKFFKKVSVLSALLLVIQAFVSAQPVIADEMYVSPQQASRAYEVGTMQTGTITEGIYIIRSNDNPDYALTIVEDRTAEGGYNLVMSKLDGGNNQKFWVAPSGGSYVIMSMQYMDDRGTSADGKWFLNVTNYGWNQATPKRDNVQATSDGVEGGKNWNIVQVSDGVYKIQVLRGDGSEFYMTSEGGVSEGANIGTGETASYQEFNFVLPYMASITDGTYSITFAENSNYAMMPNNSSVGDYAGIVAGSATGGNEQQFTIKCVDSVKGLYTIQNVNSQRYLYTQGSLLIGSNIYQISNTGADDLKWYIQNNGNGTYSIISYLSNQYLTYTVSDGAAICQMVGTENSNQQFIMNVRTTGTDPLATGIYLVNGSSVRISAMGQGVYNIFSVNSKGYCQMEGENVSYASTDRGFSTKWQIAQSGSGYIVKSLSTGKYLTETLESSDNAQIISITDASSIITDYSLRYDLSALNQLTGYDQNKYQIIERIADVQLTSLTNITDPIHESAVIKQNVEEALLLPTNSVKFTGTTVRELNLFMKDNTNKIINLTNDVEVFIDSGKNEDGLIVIPSNTVLDGNGYSLVLKDGSEIPDFGVSFYAFGGSAENVSTNCGVINLRSDIAYTFNTITVAGADNILIEGNKFYNANMNAIRINSKERKEAYNCSENVIIRGNTLGTTGQDTIGIYGNNKGILIENNTVTNSGEYGVMLSCLTDGKQTPVRDELEGPSNIIVANNDISGSKSCAVYCLGAYNSYITNNKLHDSILEGICLDSGSFGIYFANNEVYNNSQSGGLPGVSIDNSIYNIIDNNNIHDNACNGIKLVRTALGNVIVNNKCSNNNRKTDSLVHAGISIEAEVVAESDIGHLDGYGSDCNIVIGNRIEAGHTYGLMISNDTDTGRSTGNVIMYNYYAPSYEYGNVDFSTGNNTIVNNYNGVDIYQRSLVMDFARRLYVLVLNRNAEESGLAAWTDKLLSHELKGVDAGYGFVFGEECTARNLSNDEFLEMLYNTFMNRKSDSAGKSAWIKYLDGGVEREKVLEGFLYSIEFNGICSQYGIEVGQTSDNASFAEIVNHYRNQNPNITMFMARCYTKALGRNYDPDGLEAWCKALITREQTPKQAAQNFIYSIEFTNKNLSNEEYIKVLYRTFMGREADAGGMEAWLGVLNDGRFTREQALDGFADSMEFGEILKSFGLN